MTVIRKLNPLNLDTYLGNSGIKKHAVKQPYTKNELDEYIKCKNSCQYFCENYVYIINLDKGKILFKPYPYQNTMWENFEKYRFNILLASRQAGKTIGFIGYVLWTAVFKSTKKIFILANKADTAKKIVGRIVYSLEKLPFFLQPGCKEFNKSSISFSNDSSIEAYSTTSDSARGASGNLVIIDEFAFIKNDKDFYASVYPTISSGKNTKLILVSTFNSIYDKFYELWNGAIQKKNEYYSFRVDWWNVPGRDDAWKKTTLANMGKKKFDIEFGNSLSANSKTLIDPNILLSLESNKILESTNDTKIYETPIKDHKYIMCVDTARGRGQDYSVINIIDVTNRPFKQVAVYRNNIISPILFPDVVNKLGKLYNHAYAIIESNDQGSIVYNILYNEYEYPNVFTGKIKNGHTMGLEMNKKIKRFGCSNLKDLIERYELIITDLETINELKTFEMHNDSYAAIAHHHDDLVMSLVMFGWFSDTNMFNYISDSKLRNMMAEDRDKLIKESVPPVGFIGNNDNSIDYNNNPVIEILGLNDEVKAKYKIDPTFGKDFIVLVEDEDEILGNLGKRGYTF